jgi:hypothetical protein
MASSALILFLLMLLYVLYLQALEAEEGAKIVIELVNDSLAQRSIPVQFRLVRRYYCSTRLEVHVKLPPESTAH